MKRCFSCGLDSVDVATSCNGCGEASWTTTSAPEPKPIKPIATAKKKQTAKPAATPIIEEVSDTEFAEELSRATDEELLMLLNEALKPAWRVLLDAELMKRAS